MMNSTQRPFGAGAQRPPVNGTTPQRGVGTGMPQRTAAPTTARPVGAAGTAQRSPIGAQRPAAGTATAGTRSAPAGTSSVAQRAANGFGLAAAAQKLTVGIADMKILQMDGELITYALGSCIGICLYDPKLKLAALIHIMLPINREAGRKNTMKYADTGIRETLKMLEAKGARRDRMIAKIAGGAKMFEVAGNSTLGNIGQRNIESVRLNLRKEGIRILSENVGGSVARTLSFFPATGIGEIRAYGQPVITL